MVSLIPEPEYNGHQLPQCTVIKRFSFKYYDVNLYKNEKQVAEYLESHPHDNVVKYLGSCDEWDINTIGDFTKAPGFVYEYGTNYERLDLGRYSSLNDIQRIHSMKQMINAIKHLHENNIIHGRVGSNDFILCKNPKNGEPCVKLGGFDKSRLFTSDLIGGKGMYTHSVLAVELCFVLNYGSHVFILHEQRTKRTVFLK